MVAAKGGHVETVVALIEHGAVVNLKSQVNFGAGALRYGSASLGISIHLSTHEYHLHIISTCVCDCAPCLY